MAQTTRCSSVCRALLVRRPARETRRCVVTAVAELAAAGAAEAEGRRRAPARRGAEGFRLVVGEVRVGLSCHIMEWNGMEWNGTERNNGMNLFEWNGMEGTFEWTGLDWRIYRNIYRRRSARAAVRVRLSAVAVAHTHDAHT